MGAIAARWRYLAANLKEQSERERCAPALFERAGLVMQDLAEAEDSFFRELRQLVDSEDAWDTGPR